MDQIEDSFRSKLDQKNDIQSKLALARFLSELGDNAEKLAEAEKLFNEVITDAISNQTPTPREKRDIGRIYGWVAVFLESQRRYDEAEENYKKSIEIDPNQPLSMGNYAVFVQKIRRNRSLAYELFEAALKAHPHHVTIMVKFASLKKICGDLDGAEDLYKAAIEVEMNLSDSSGSYAVFLHAVRQNATLAQTMYEKAIKADPTHANNLSNYGLFLSDVRHDYFKAEQLYQRALEAEPNHANALYNYAVLLDSSLGQPERAEEMYRDVLKEEPKHAYALYNIAVLLEEKLSMLSSSSSNGGSGNNEEVLGLYERAVEAAPKDALSRADLGRFLLIRLKNRTKALATLEKALELDPENAVALYNLGLLYGDTVETTSSSGSDGNTSSKASLDKAATYWRKLVDEVDHGHVNGLRRLARLEMEKLGNSKQADRRYVVALNTLSASLGGGSPSSASTGSGGGGASQNASSTSRVACDRCSELDGLISEVLQVMAPAPARVDQAKLLAEKLKRRT